MAARTPKAVTTTVIVPLRYGNKTYRVGEDISLPTDIYNDLAYKGFVLETQPIAESEGAGNGAE